MKEETHQRAAQRDVIKLIRWIGAFARGTALNGKSLNKEERAALLKQRRQMANGAAEVMKIIKRHPHEHAREHALIHLHRAILGAFMVGRGATVSATAERRGNALAAKGRKSQEPKSRGINEIIIREARGLMDRHPNQKNNNAFLARHLLKCAALKPLGYEQNTYEKKLRNLRKEGRLT